MNNLAKYYKSQIKSTQSMQTEKSSVTPVSTYDKAASSRLRTRMTRIARIFTDTHNPCVSASTVAPVDVAHTYGSRHTWRSVFYPTDRINHCLLYTSPSPRD